MSQIWHKIICSYDRSIFKGFFWQNVVEFLESLENKFA